MLLNRNDFINTSGVYKRRLEKQSRKILVCGGTGCVAGGSLQVYDRFVELMQEKGIECEVSLEKEPHDKSVGIKKSG